LDKAVDKAPDAFRTISEVADDLDLPQHVLRFWETRFVQIRPMKRGGGRRFYRREDIDLLRGIRHLLYGEGYTIRGVQRILKDHGAKFVQSVWQAGAPQPAKLSTDAEESAAASPPADEAREAPRGRGLFGILPAFRGGDTSDEASPESSSDERAEPRVESDERPGPLLPLRGPAARAPAESPSRPLARANVKAEAGVAPSMPVAAKRTGGLAGEHLRKLQAALQELGECRQLIDQVLGEKTS